MGILNLLDYAGVFVFAISGIAFASEKKLDVFGAFVIAFVTAIGGGTLRDMLVGNQANWISDHTPLYLVIAGTIIGLLFLKHFKRVSNALFLFDTLGIGAFTILGLQKCLALGISPMISVMMGVISAVFGGVIRDILCSRTPLIFHKEIYATPCILGGVSYLVMDSLDWSHMITTITATAVIVIIRLLAVKFEWTLPRVGT